ncbi:NAAT family transporter [Sulfurimonas sp. HSL1-2]|uniref:MarC family protein n=1 Tax=Thiomicrolovo zhangzhouensis TaxID=3131933 RepID=UPI0031F80597
MNFDVVLYVQMAIALFTILDPIGAIPLYLSMTQGQSRIERRRQIRRTVIAVAVILSLSALAGNAILDFFGIDIHVFQTAGGLFLLLIALNMLQAKGPLIKTTPKEQSEAIEKEDVSVVPLAMPLLSGPGAISTVIIFSSSMEGYDAKAVFIGTIVVVALTVWPILTLAKWLGDRIGATGMNIAVRIMGLILASIAVKFILEGVKAYLF